MYSLSSAGISLVRHASAAGPRFLAGRKARGGKARNVSRMRGGGREESGGVVGVVRNGDLVVSEQTVEGNALD
jgi:hypothetical protein